MRGHYCLIRVLPDPVRNEPLNVGVIAWFNGVQTISIHDGSVKRAILASRTFDRSALVELESFVREEYRGIWDRSDPEHEWDRVAEVRNPYVQLTEPRYLRIMEDISILAQLDQHVASILARLVAPVRRRPDQRQPVSRPADLIAASLRPLIRDEVVRRDYLTPPTVSGDERQINFFVNSSVKAALDVFGSYNRGRPGLPIATAERQAYKIIDLMNSQVASSYTVYIPVDVQPRLEDHVTTVTSILTSYSDAKVELSQDEAVRRFRDHIPDLLLDGSP